MNDNFENHRKKTKEEIDFSELVEHAFNLFEVQFSMREEHITRANSLITELNEALAPIKEAMKIKTETKESRKLHEVD